MSDCFLTASVGEKTDGRGFLPPVFLLSSLALISSCGSEAPTSLTDSGVDSGPDGDTDTGADSDTDTDSDSDTDTDTGPDSDSDTDSDTETQTDTGSDTCDEYECQEPFVRFVDGQAAAPGDGLSWEGAFAKIQEGVDAAGKAWVCCQEAHQVWVALGRYYIYESSLDDTVQLVPGVTLLGGFKGDETSVEERDFKKNKTVLDGADGPDGSSFAFHVVTGGDSAEIDGFTVTQGKAVGSEFPDNAGGGMINIDAEVTVRNCIFSKNLAGGDSGDQIGSGGGIYIKNGSVIVEDSTFLENQAAYGGGLFVIGDDNSTELVNCRFVANTADYVDDGSGGAVANFGEQVVVRNSVFYANSATRVGGAFYENGKSTIANCTFAYNHTVWNWGGGALHVTSVNTPTVLNSIVWDNYPQEVHIDVFSFADMAFSDIRGGFEGDGNIDSDPMFVDPQRGIFQLEAGSPCIDAADGDAALEHDMAGNPRVDDPETKNTGAGSPDYVDM
jgi:hypothetical protein